MQGAVGGPTVALARAAAAVALTDESLSAWAPLDTPSSGSIYIG